jgi:hypothetical protein
MKAKLTLSVDTKVIHFAKQHALRRGESVSSMFSELLMAQKVGVDRSAQPSVAEMLGSLSKYDIDDSKGAIQAAYARKHTSRS